MNRKLNLFIALCVLALTFACSSPGGNATSTESPEIDAGDMSAGNSLQILSASPSPEQGFSAGDTQVSLSVHYSLAGANGILNIWFERFQDPGCTQAAFDADGNASYVLSGNMQDISAGDQQVTLDLQFPVWDSPYVGIGAMIWNGDQTAVLVENPGYLCFAVNSTAATGDWVEIVSSTPSLQQGLSVSDAEIVLTVHYSLSAPEAMLQVWYMRFQDPACTELGFDPSGSSDLVGGTLQSVTDGEQDISLITEVPPLDTSFVGVGVRMWGESSTILAENPQYYCFRVNPAP